jgi:dolichol-phosphate mannosyltransferase
MISVVVPIYREAENLEPLAAAIDGALSPLGLAYEVVFVDDGSRDGSTERCRRLSERLPVRMVVREGERGLASAVLRGFEEARGDLLVVMDADLSHPPSAIPAMVAALESGEADFVVGSRYVAGGSVHEGFAGFRRLNSLVPTLLARPLAAIRDPMSGFFALRRSEVPARERLDPVGFKIGLELLVKGGFERPLEVPIHFGERLHGQSKLTLGQRVAFLRHLGALYRYRRPGIEAILGPVLDGARALVQTIRRGARPGGRGMIEP